MPEFTRDDGTIVTYASEDEVLAFANKIRAAGGANALDALLPSQPRVGHACLIATALNFGCSVGGIDEEGDPWCMTTGQKSESDILALANAIGCPTRRIDADGKPRAQGDLVIQLPQLIGNAAEAFDECVGWTARYLSLPVED